MPLSGRLLHENLTFHCPHCDFAIIRSEGWFQTVGRYRCRACDREVRLTYDDKLALFDKHTDEKRPRKTILG
jgi:hypothetical protein